MEERGLPGSTPGSSKEKIMDNEVIIRKIKAAYESYEDKDNIKYICISKKLYVLLKKPATILDLEVIVEPELFKYAYFFVTSKEYEIPPRAHSIEFKEVVTTALKVTRIVSPLYDTAQYQTEIAGKTTMNELAFLLANVIREMDENNFCKKEDMLKNINNYLND